MSELVRRFGHQSAIELLQQWPARKRGQIWFSLLTEHMFQYSADIDSQTFLSSDKDCQYQVSPHQIYQTALDKFQSFNAGYSSEGYCQFMTWLVHWPIMNDFPQDDRLLEIPEQYRTMRPDFLVIQGEKRAMNKHCGWGFMGPVSDYLAHTKRLKYFMTCSLIENAPKSHKEALLNHWLKDGAEPKTIDTLFSCDLHPLSKDVFETHLHHSLLYLIDSLLPDCRSGLRDDLNQIHLPKANPVRSDSSCFTSSEDVPAAKVFGRTLYHQHCERPDDRLHYLKVQNQSESTKDVHEQFAKLDYFARNGKEIGLISEPVCPEKLVSLPELSKTLLKNKLSTGEVAKIHWMCSEDDFETTFDDLLEQGWDHSCYKSTHKAKRTRWTELLDEGSCLPAAKRQKLTEGLTSKGIKRVGIQFSCA